MLLFFDSAVLGLLLLLDSTPGATTFRWLASNATTILQQGRGQQREQQERGEKETLAEF